MAKLKRYAVQVQSGRNVVDTILKLTPEEAERLGGTEYVKGGKPPSGRTRAAKSRTTASKPRTPRNKATKPAADKTAKPSEAAGGIEDATDPGASE